MRPLQVLGVRIIQKPKIVRDAEPFLALMREAGELKAALSGNEPTPLPVPHHPRFVVCEPSIAPFFVIPCQFPSARRFGIAAGEKWLTSRIKSF